MTGQEVRRGGPRPGSGRPRIGKGRRVQMSVSVDEEVRAMARELRDYGYDINTSVALCIRRLHKNAREGNFL